MAAEQLLSSKTKEQIEAEAKALQGAVATTNLSERPLNNVTTNPNYAADLARQQARAQENRNLAAAADSLPGSTPEYQAAVGKLFDARTQSVLSTRPDLQTLAANKGIDMRVPAIAEDWRNRQKEQEYIKKLGGSPRTAEEYDLMMKAVYPTSVLQANNWKPTAVLSEGAAAMAGGSMGQAGQIAAYNPETLKKAGFSDEQIQSLMASGNAANAAQGELNATPKPTNAQLGVLQAALKAKSGVGNQAIGTSQLFDKAGISTKGAGGYAALAQSLSQRRAEMGQTYDSYANLVQQVGGQMTDIYNAALDNYKATMGAYESQVAMIEKTNAEAREYERSLDFMYRQAELEKETETWKKELEAKYRTGNFSDFTDENGNIGVLNKDTGEINWVNGKDNMVVGDQVVSDNWLADVFGVGSKGGQCGTWASTISTATKVGNMWSEKRTKIDKQDNPTAGDKLLIPLGVASGTNKYGHVATVLSYDPATRTVKVVESNKNNDEKITMGTYNLDELRKKYGDDWGFASGELKPGVQKKLAGGSLGSVINAAVAGYQSMTAQPEGTIGPGLNNNPIGGVVGALAYGGAEALKEIASSRWAGYTNEQKYLRLTGKLPADAELKRLNKLSEKEANLYFENLAKEKANSADKNKINEVLLHYKAEKAREGQEFDQQSYLNAVKEKYGEAFYYQFIDKL